jgi:ribose 5-phosphate isomerase B
MGKGVAMKIAIASDHAGLQLKKLIQKEIQEYMFEDFGPQDSTSVDYPDFAEKACRSVIAGKNERAILICGSGIGMSIAANKIEGIRAAHSESTYTAQLAGEHNNANVLCIGERITGPGMALAMVRSWLGAKFETRHQKRIDKIHALEKK